MEIENIKWIRSKEYPYEIYVITNRVNGKVYVGQTKQGIDTRMKQHRCPSDGCPALKRAYEKYGKDAFEVLKLDSAKTREDANRKEKMWIALYDSTNSVKGYNLSKGGVIGDFNDETLKKMSLSKMGEKNSFWGKHHTEETKQKMSKTRKGLHIGEKHPRAKRVLCVETGVIYNCIKDADIATGASRHHICQVCEHKHGRKTAGGYHWEYV